MARPLLTFCVATFTILVATLALDAQSLSGTSLQQIENGDALLDNIFGHFLGDSYRDQHAAIDRVVVKEESARRLVLTIAYKGLADSLLVADVRGRDRRPQPQIASEPVRLTAPSGETTIVLNYQPTPADNGAIDSGYLTITAKDQSRGTTMMERLFRLPKRWQNADTGSLVTIVPQPIGTAATLGSRPDYAPPPMVKVPLKTITPGAAVISRDRVMRTAPRDGAPSAQATPQIAQRVQMSPAVAAARQDTIAKTTTATAQLPQRAGVLQVGQFHFGVRPEDVQKGAQGPAAAPIELLEGLRTEDIDVNPAQLLSVASTIYPDKNPASGVFYFHPRSYHLEWTPESGHGMRILYGAAATAGNSGDVLMAARLQSGLDSAEIQLATDLLNAYRGRNPSTAFTALRPLPLEKDGLDVSLAAVLGQYSIPKEKIAITGLSDVLGEIEVSWITDPVTKENLQLALTEDVGVNGMVTFAGVGGAVTPQVPIAIRLADRDSFGRIRWSRTDGYVNQTPYPIRLRYLHALVIDPRNHLPILYSWSLGNTELAPQSSVKWDGSKIPAWIDTEARRIWIDYGVLETCDACDKRVLDTITGGVTSITADQITFHTITPLADVGGYEITAQVRSKYFDPKDRTSIQKSVVLKADNQDVTLKPIYNGAQPGEPIFEYLLELAMPDGTIYKGTTWIPSDGLRVLVGRAQLQQSLGTLPGKLP